MALQDGKNYRNNDGTRVSIQKRTKHYPDWVWSLQGNWYVRETGQFVLYSPGKGPDEHPDYKLLPVDSRSSISNHVAEECNVQDDS